MEEVIIGEVYLAKYLPTKEYCQLRTIRMKEIIKYHLEEPVKDLIDVLLEIDSPFHQRIKYLIKEEAVMYITTTGSASHITLAQLLT